MPDDILSALLARDRQPEVLWSPAQFVGFEEARRDDANHTTIQEETPRGRYWSRETAVGELRRRLSSLAGMKARVSPGKLVLALCCLVAALYLLGPRIFFIESERAITNAPLVTLRAEFFGTVKSVVQVGTEVGVGDSIAAITNAAWDPAQLLEVERRLRDAEARKETAEQDTATLRALRSRLEGQYDVWRHSMSESAASQVVQAEEQQQAAQARLTAAQTNLSRYNGLASDALVSQQRLTDIRRDYSVAIRDERAAAAAVKVAQQQKETIKAGISLGSTDRPPTLQLMNEIDIHLATEAAALNAAEGDVKTYQRQREEMLHLREQQTRINLVSPVHGSVWRTFAHPGDAIPAHSPVAGVVDCERLGITAIFNQRHVQSLVPGRRVSVQLVGIDENLWGSIERVNGYYQADDRAAEAIALKPDDSPAVIVWVTLDKPLPSCWVGLEATVRLR